MLRVSKAILHVFDFETGTKHFSDTALDLEDRQTRSYVQRRLRKITSNPESRHGEFAEKSNFAGGFHLTALHWPPTLPCVRAGATFVSLTC